MSQLNCALCNNDVESAEFNLQKSLSLYSKSSLLVLLQSCIKERLFITNYFICKECYFLLNELDSIKVRAKVIEDQLRNYAKGYTETKKELLNPLSAKSEGLIGPNPNTALRNFKSHVKTQDAEPDGPGRNISVNKDNSLFGEGYSEVDTRALDAEKRFLKTYVKGSKDRGDVSKPFECHQCAKKWRTLTELKNHILTHSNERPFICEICGQAYKRQQALIVHVGMHNGVHPFTCVYCNKSFTQKGALVRHTPIHTGEFPFQCDLCGKRFVHHTSFNMHKLSHSGVKSHKCEVCGMLLMSGSHLKRHMRVHTGEKRYSCFTCGRKFAEKYNLGVHEKLHLAQARREKYPCNSCDKIYHHQDKLQEHLQIDHGKIEHPIEQIFI